MLYLGPKSFDNQAATLEQVVLLTFGVMHDKYFQSKTVFAQKQRSPKNFSEYGHIFTDSTTPYTTPRTIRCSTAYYTGNYTPHTSPNYSIALLC